MLYTSISNVIGYIYPMGTDSAISMELLYFGELKQNMCVAPLSNQKNK